MSELLASALVIGLVALPFRSVRLSPRYLAVATIALALGCYFYLLYLAPRLPWG